MYQSPSFFLRWIPTVTFPPGYRPPGICHFYFTWHPISYSRAQRKRQYLPHLGTLKTNCIVSQEDGNIYYILQNRSTWTCMHTKVRKHLSHCFCFSSVFLWLVALLCCIFFKHWLYMDKLFSSNQLRTNWRDFPAKKSALTAACRPVLFSRRQFLPNNSLCD